VNVDEFLALRGVDLPAVMAAVDERFGLADEDMVLSVGSLAEGLGNSKSDFDLLLIGPPRSGEDGGTVAIVVGRCLVDVRVLPVDEVCALLDRFESWSSGPWDLAHAAGFTVDERTLLHRLRHGDRLHEGRRSVVDKRVPSVPDLSRLKLHVARQHARTIQVDMAGSRDAKDHRTLTFAAQELLGQAVDALLAAYGLTNALAKWRSRLLDLLPADWEDRLAPRPSGMRAGDLVWDLHRAPREPDEGSVLRHAFDISTFARAVFAWAESVLLGWPAGAPGASWAAAGADDGSATLPLLDFDVDFAPTPHGAMLARLNEFGSTLELSSADFALALLFDGRTRESEAAVAVYGQAGNRDAVARIVSQVRDAQLTFAPDALGSAARVSNTVSRLP
jgi:hypothetical protein